MPSETTDFDLESPAYYADPYRAYTDLRAQPAPHFYRDSWLVSRYDDVAALLKETQITKRMVRAQTMPLDLSMVFQDPPTHTRLRGLVNQAFTPRRLKRLDQRIFELADASIARVQRRGSMDFIAEFALPLPVTIIAEMLGVPAGDQEAFLRHSVDFVTAGDQCSSAEECQAIQWKAMCALTEYFTGLIAHRRTNPKDDILSGLIEASEDQDRLSSEELIGNAILLLIAGHETTVNLFGNGLYTLLRHPDQLALLRSQPDLLGSAIEEMLRYESPIQAGTFRAAAAPLQIGGTPIETGDSITLLLGAANRDPEQFPDPDRFDITRTPNRHLGFGLGIHFCLGAALARSEAKIGFTPLLERLPNLRLAGAPAPTTTPHPVVRWLHRFGATRRAETIFAPNWRTNTIIRGLKSLPIEW